MKALILKDFYVLWKQVRLFLLIMVFVAVANGIFGTMFIVVWAALLPYTAMAYDEQCKWDRLAAMLPYSTKDLVLSKYVLGWLCAGAAAVLSLVIQTASRVLGPLSQPADPTMLLLAFCGSLCVMAVIMPMMFRFGVEKARWVMMLLIFLVCGGTGALTSVVIDVGSSGPALPAPVLALLPLAALVLTAVSIPVSLRLYKARR